MYGIETGWAEVSRLEALACFRLFQTLLAFSFLRTIPSSYQLPAIL
jgi:hypothetical protein